MVKSFDTFQRIYSHVDCFPWHLPFLFWYLLRANHREISLPLNPVCNASSFNVVLLWKTWTLKDFSNADLCWSSKYEYFFRLSACITKNLIVEHILCHVLFQFKALAYKICILCHWVSIFKQISNNLLYFMGTFLDRIISAQRI